LGKVGVYLLGRRVSTISRVVELTMSRVLQKILNINAKRSLS
jgi:hypothetical protein